MSETITTSNVRDHIEKWNQEMDACLVRGDLEGYAAFYSDEATIIGFEKRKIQGREAINQFCFAMTGVKEAKAVVLDVWMSGDFICQVQLPLPDGKETAKREAIFAIACMYGAKRRIILTVSSWMPITKDG